MIIIRLSFFIYRQLICHLDILIKYEMVYTLCRMSEAVIKQESITRKPGAFEKRIHEIDLIRGFLIGLVVMDHIFCFVTNFSRGWPSCQGLYQFTSFYWYSQAREIVRFFALAGFCTVSGISTAFSKNNWIRAGQMIALAFGLSAVTNIANTFLLSKIGNAADCLIIDFNVIAVLGFSTLFYCFFQKGTWRRLAAAMLVLFIISWTYYPHLITFVGNKYINFPPLFEPKNYADWMPLFPFIFFFFAGALISTHVYMPERKSLFSKRYNWERPLCFMGRHSLIIYATHVLIIIGVLSLLNLALGK